MEGEMHFFPKLEQKEITRYEHRVDFNQARFGEEEIDPKIIENWTKGRRCGWLPRAINDWWHDICKENKFKANERRKFDKSHDCLLELGKNAFEYSGGGEIKVIFEPKKIIITVSDNGSGFDDNPNSIMVEHHGLYFVNKYADELIIETNGKKYSKVRGSASLLEISETDIMNGSKITFIKNFE
ncbi:MAG: hypothetical protein WCK16_05005 [Candidatus Moraniibacteriota bacterium]